MRLVCLTNSSHTGQDVNTTADKNMANVDGIYTETPDPS
jgi:hypothetical protein